MAKIYEIPGRFTEPRDVTLHNETGETATLRYNAGEEIKLSSKPADGGPVDPPPSSGEWPDKAWTPVNYETEDINGNLRAWLEAHPYAPGEPPVLLVLNDARELNELAQQRDPSILGHHLFTCKPDEFYQHRLTVNFGGQTLGYGPGFQGFNFAPSGGGYHARHYGQGQVGYNLCKMTGGYKGIAQTGADSNMVIRATNTEISGMRGKACAGVYMVRGSFVCNELVITEIGHARGEPRPARGEAQLNHLVYLQWDCWGGVTNLYGDTVDSHAIQFRGGGHLNGLICNRSANGVLFGGDKTDRPMTTNSMERAIIVNTEDVDPERQKTGVGVWTQRGNTTIENSIIADEKSAGMGSAIRPQNDSTVDIGPGVHVQGINRLIDVDGHRAKITGGLGWVESGNPDSIKINARKYETESGGRQRYDTGGVHLGATPVTPKPLPDFDNVLAPEPGKVGAMIDGILA